jgi:calcium permeable stress-gated cation channel
VYDEQLTACNRLESAETQIIRSAIKAKVAAATSDNAPPPPSKDKDAEKGKSKSGSIAALVPPNERPTHRLGFFGLWGKKVDSIDWAREEITRCGEVLKSARATIHADDGEEEEDEETAPAKGTQEAGKEKEKENYPVLNSAFITFEKQISAHIARQVLTHHDPYRCIPVGSSRTIISGLMPSVFLS